MDAVDTINIIRRRKRVVIPLLVLTGLLLALAVSMIPPGYSARGSVLVQDSIASSSPVTPALFAESLQDQSAKAKIRESGATGTYTIDSVDDLLRVRARGATAESAVETANAVLQSMGAQMELREEEADVDPALRSQISVLNAPLDAVFNGTEYEATGAAQVVRANAGSAPIAAETLREALVEVLSSADVAESIADDGGTAAYEFAWQNGSPLLGIEATGSDEETTVRTVELLVEAAGVEAAKLAAASGQTATGPLTQDLVVPASASIDRKGPLRSIAAILIVGLGLSISAAIAVDAYSEWRRRNEQAAVHPDRSDLPDPPIAAIRDRADSPPQWRAGS